MSGPHGIITVDTSFQRAYESDMECCELAATTIASKELANIREAVAKDAPDSKRQAGAFEPVENTKEVPVDPSGSDGKVLRISSDLSPQIGKHARQIPLHE
jgi:hypothetical protein